jgi:hypothetical protein
LKKFFPPCLADVYLITAGPFSTSTATDGSESFPSSGRSDDDYHSSVQQPQLMQEHDDEVEMEVTTVEAGKQQGRSGNIELAEYEEEHRASSIAFMQEVVYEEKAPAESMKFPGLRGL